MIYVFDTSSLSKLKHFFPRVFKSVWGGLDALVQSGDLISTREVWNEIERGDVDPHTHKWLKDRKQIFTTPTSDEQRFVARIFQIPHFQSLIGEKQRLTGTPVADPFVIACAKVRKGSSYAIAGALGTMAQRLENQIKATPAENLTDKLDEDYESLMETEEEWTESAQPGLLRSRSAKARHVGRRFEVRFGKRGQRAGPSDKGGATHRCRVRNA